MASRLLRNIAVTIGAGLAVGLGRKLAIRQAYRPAPNLSPILTRLEQIESRVSRVEHAPVSLAAQAPEEIAALGTLVSSQSEDIASLREDILRIERRNTEQTEAFGQKVALLQQQVPNHIEASINAKMAELEQRLRGEFQTIHHRSVDAFADTIEQRVVGRITAIEHSLTVQGQSIDSLRDKSLKTDDHLQRLLEAVEKLCARAESQSHISLLQLEPSPKAPETIAEPEPEVAPAGQPATGIQDSFVDHYKEALRRQDEAEPELVGVADPSASFPSDSPSRRGLKPVGMAILGLAILGFRLIR
jgi:hypothetical protein